MGWQLNCCPACQLEAVAISAVHFASLAFLESRWPVSGLDLVFLDSSWNDMTEEGVEHQKMAACGGVQRSQCAGKHLANSSAGACDGLRRWGILWSCGW